MRPQSSVSLSPTSVDSLGNLLSRLEGGNVTDIFGSRETDEATGDFHWTIYVGFSDLESARLVLAQSESGSWKLV